MSATVPTGVFIQEGDIMNYTNAGASALNNGDVVTGAGACGIVTGNGIAIGATGPVVVHGVFQLPAASAVSWAAFDKLYWDATNACLTNVTTNNTYIGFAQAAKATAVTIAQVKLNN
jgi:predicted RecA/RadA family phage recombinase